MIELPTYNQWDKEWGQKKMLPSNLTMGRYGCFVTSVCMALHNFAIDWNPGEFLDRLIEVNGINPWGLLKWEGVMDATNNVVYYHRRIYTDLSPDRRSVEMRIEVAVSKVKRMLDLGQPVVLAVDRLNNDKIQDHAVLAYDYKMDGDVIKDFRIKDPDGGRDIWFSKRYGEIRDGLFGLVMLIGSPIRFPDQSDDHKDGKAIWKASQIKQGISVNTYSKEIIDTLL